MKYYIFVNGQQIGPMTIDQLRFYNVNSDTQVRNETCADWKSLMYYPELMQVYGPNAKAQTSCPPRIEQPQPYYTPSPVYPKKNDNSWVIWLIAVLVGLPIIGTLLYFLFLFFVIIAAG